VFYVAFAVFVLIALVIARAQFNLWGGQPVVHTDLALDQVAPLVRSWAPWLQERGRIVIRQAQTDAEVELRKHRFSTRPDAIIFRIRNVDSNKKHFTAIRGALDAARVPYELKTTRRKGEARAIEVSLAADDVRTPAAALKLIQEVFRGTAGYQIHCEGRMRRPPDVPQVPLLPWRRDYAAGAWIGQRVGRAVRRLFG
jgi:hypothetical protein